MTISQVITALPVAPDPATMTATEFSNAAAASVLAQRSLPTEINAFGTQANALAVTVSADAVSAAAAALLAVQSAAAAVLTANSTLWVTGTTYALGANVYSPLYPQVTYRRIVAGAGATDPSADPTNWAPISGGIATAELITVTGSWICQRTGFYKVTVQDGGYSGATNAGVSTAASNGGAAGWRLLWLVAGVTYTATIGAAGAINGAGTSLPSTAGGATSFSGSGITTLTSANAYFKAPGGRAVSIVGSGTSGDSLMSPSDCNTGNATNGYGIGSGSTGTGAAGSAGRPGAVLIEG
ncbi:MAG: hypothetical protein V4684_19525 [Pseudomonadota bacterium]